MPRILLLAIILVLHARPSAAASEPLSDAVSDAGTDHRPTLLVGVPSDDSEATLLDVEQDDLMGPYRTLIPISPSAPKPPDTPPKALRFIKGELIYPGTRRLLSRFDHFGVTMGATVLDGDVWATLAPGMAWYFDMGLAMSFHVPLRLLAVDLAGTEVSFGGLKVRRQDWDEVADFAKVIRFITFGRKESNIYATINTMRPATIGHGMLMRGYQGDIDVDRSLTGLIFDAYNDYGGFQLQLNDITLQNRILGGLAFIKPLSFLTTDERLRSLSIGVEYMADTRAPRCIQNGVDGVCVTGTGHAAGFDPYSGASRDATFVRTDPDLGRYMVDQALVHALGTSVEFKFYKDTMADLKAYGTYHRFLNEGGGSGASLGVLARLNVGDTWRHAFRLRGEYRTFGDGFRPSYFNTMYEIHKYEYLARARSYQVTPTKYQQVFGDPANGFVRPDYGQRHGINLDLSWGLFKWRRSAKKIAIGVGLQEASGPYDTSVYAHIEFPMLEFLQLFATYMAQDVDSLREAFDMQRFGVVMAGLRLQVLPILFVNAHYAHTYRAIASPGTELHLGNDTVVDGTGAASAYFPQSQLFEPVHSVFVEIELGWEFMDRVEEPKP